MIRAEVDADTRGQLLSGQDAVSFSHRSLAMYPLRLDVVQPGAFGGQQTGNDLNARLTLSPTIKHLLVVRSYPVAHFSADMPGSIVPDEHQHPLAFLTQPLAHPLQVSSAHMADWSPINEAQKHLAGVFPQKPIAAQCFWVLFALVAGAFRNLRNVKLLQTQWLPLFSPGVHTWLRVATPPYLVCIADYPTLRCSANGTPNQGVSSLFLRVYSGSGEVIQSLALSHPTPSLCRVTRMRSMLTSRSVTPCSRHTSAASASVHTEVGLPKVRGLWCKIARNRSAFSASKMGCTVFGRRDFGRKQSSPSEWQALMTLMTLRTICKEQPRLRAISEGRWPLEEASSIWHRRIVKAEEERRPATKTLCSSSVRFRTNKGAFMPHSIKTTHTFTHYLS